MYVAILPGFAVWLQRRGVPLHSALRAEYLNRNVTAEVANKLADNDKLTFAQQAATALKASFDWTDTREGATFWGELTVKLEKT